MHIGPSKASVRPDDHVATDQRVAANCRRRIDPATFPDHRIAGATPGDGYVDADLDIILDDDAAQAWRARSGAEIGSSVTDADAGVHDDPVTDERVRNADVGVDGAIAPYPDTGSDDAVGPHATSRPDLRTGAHDNTRIDRDSSLKSRIGVDHGGAVDTARPVQRPRTQAVWMQDRGKMAEGALRIGDDEPDRMRGKGAAKALCDQAGARTHRGGILHRRVCREHRHFVGTRGFRHGGRTDDERRIGIHRQVDATCRGDSGERQRRAGSKESEIIQGVDAAFKQPKAKSAFTGAVSSWRPAAKAAAPQVGSGGPAPKWPRLLYPRRRAEIGRH